MCRVLGKARVRVGLLRGCEMILGVSSEIIPQIGLQGGKHLSFYKAVDHFLDEESSAGPGMVLA